MDFAEWLSRRREELGWTQEQLAQKLGVRALAVSRWESGKQMPPASRRAMIERVLAEPEMGSHVSERREEYRPGATRIPLYLMGHIAGTTDGEPERIEDLEVPDRFARLADSAFVIHGSSMEPEFINGDIVGVKRTPQAAVGQLVIALVDGELTFKRFDGVVDNKVLLTPLNSDHAPILAGEVEIIGTYRWSIRESRDGKLRDSR